MTDKMNEFLNKVDQLCFEYGYTIDAATVERVPVLLIRGENDSKIVQYIDGDGGFELPLLDKEGGVAK